MIQYSSLDIMCTRDTQILSPMADLAACARVGEIPE